MFQKLPTPRASASRRGSRAALLGVAAMMLATSAACGEAGTSGTAGSGRGGDEMVWGKPADVDTMDPGPAGNARTWEILHLSYNKLVGLDKDLKPVPELAESWEQTSPTTYVFNMRKGVRFSNGREVTADDVAGSLTRVMDPKVGSIWAGLLGIRTTEAVGGSQVKVTLVRPRTSFVPALAGTPASILPMKELEDGTFDPEKQILGTGPFKVADHAQNTSWTFVRNPYYWQRGIPKVSKLTVRIIPDDAARVAALRNGTIDVSTFDAPDTLRLLKGQANVKTVVEPTTDFYRLDVNARTSIFEDDRLRQALALSIDRSRIRDVAMGGVGRPTAPIPVAFNGVCDPATVPLGTPDLERAKRLVRQAGATGGAVEILTISSVPMGSPIAQVLQQSLQSIGLKVRITSVESGEAAKRAFSGRADFDILVSWSAGYADPGMLLSWWNPDIAVYNKGFLRHDPKLDALIDTFIGAPTGEERTRNLREACNLAAQGANVISLVTKDAIIAYRQDRISPVMPDVEGYAVPLRFVAEFEKK